MRKIHFFNARSRIGISHLTHGSHTLNIGVEDGGKIVLTKDFLTNFPDWKIDQFNFSKPEEIKKDFEKVLLKEILQFKDLIIKNLKKDEMQVVIGGDHVVSLASILALSERAKDIKKIGYIHFDSHADLNLYTTSPSGNFHGMYIRILMDKFDLTEFNELVLKKFPKANFLFIGDLELDPEEKIFFETSDLKNISHQMIIKNWRKVKSTLDDFRNHFPFLHISFDIDVFAKKLAPATGTPSKSGFSKKQIFLISEVLKKHQNISFDLCEVNPKKRGRAKTVKLAQEVLSLFLPSARI